MKPKIETTEPVFSYDDMIGFGRYSRVSGGGVEGAFRSWYDGPDPTARPPTTWVAEGNGNPSGAAMIAAERTRQLEEWSVEHDARHTTGDLALAAACYATPEKLFRRREFANVTSFEDPFPWNRGDSRMRKGERRENPGNVVPDPETYTTADRIELLVKAGALIAAEIDRVKRLGSR